MTKKEVYTFMFGVSLLTVLSALIGNVLFHITVDADHLLIQILIAIIFMSWKGIHDD